MRGIALGVALLTLSATAASAAPLALSVTSAVVSRDPGGLPGMTIVLSPDSATAFAVFTGANLGKAIDLRIDGKTVMSPVVVEPITGGELRISGTSLSPLEMNAIALRILAGTAKLEAEAR
jgi:preprotein translocase subunit SecD